MMWGLVDNLFSNAKDVKMPDKLSDHSGLTVLVDGGCIHGSSIFWNCLTHQYHCTPVPDV